jgi:uncharacterized membrane protein YgcG
MVRLVLLGVVFAAVSPGAPARAEETIRLFKSDIIVNADSTVSITETITVTAEGVQILHGIYRDFPTRYIDRFGNTIVVAFDVLNVQRNGMTEAYHLKDQFNGKRLYIGSQEYLLPAGEYTYTISYRTNRQIGFFKDFDELYWNVTGNGWSFAIEKAEASVRLPGKAFEHVITYTAYTGYFRKKGGDFTAQTDIFGAVNFSTTRPLAAHEGLTIAVSWPKGYVREPAWAEKAGYFFSDNRTAAAGLLGLLIVVSYYLFVWNLYGRDPAKGTIIPLFDPPDGFSPQEMRFIMKMGFDHKVFAAAIINIAVKGWLRIEEDHSGYRLIRTGIGDSALTPREKLLCGRLFPGAAQVIELQNTNAARIKSALSELSHGLKLDYEKTYFLTNLSYFIKGVVVSLLCIAACVLMQTGERKAIAVFMSFWLTIWSVGTFALSTSLCAAWRNVFTSRAGLVSVGGALFMTLFSLPFIAGEIFGIAVFAHAVSLVTVLVLLCLAGVNALFYHLLKAPTALGRAVMDRIEGFRMYLSAAERDRLNILNLPKKTPELFEKYLPYALALDVEQSWAEQFSHVLSQAGTGLERSYHPGWYSGDRWGSVYAGAFVSGFAASFASAIASSSTPPGSSGGSGGGGSSGGGGGGGGGGGW